MASGRFISSTLGDSEKFSSLTDPRYQVAFILIVTWADAEGRFIADPITLNGKLFTRLGWTPDLVRAALDQLHDVGLVTLYQVDGKPYGVVEKFHQYNTITRKADGTPAREAASKLPPPPEQPRSGSGGTGQPPPSSSAPTAQKPRSNRAAATPEVEVEVQVELEEPPLPPHEPQATSSEEAEGEDPGPSKAEATQDDLTHYQRRRRDRPPDPLPGSRLATLHPEAWAALTDFRRAIGDVTEGQFTAWAKTVAEHVDEHGEAAVADALRRTLEKTRLKHPFAYYRKVIGQPKSPTGDAADAEYREVTAAEFLEGRWN